MRRLTRKYIHQQPQWPHFYWDHQRLEAPLAKVRHRQGRLLGKMEGLGFSLKAEATLNTLTLDVLKSSEIEAEILNHDQVRSSIARRLGMDIAGLTPSDKKIDGVVEMMLDATQHYEEKLPAKRLFAWHALLFPTGYSGSYKIVTGTWRNNPPDDPMQVVSGALGREKVHFQAPDSDKLPSEMKQFLHWLNTGHTIDPIVKAAIAHLWFVTIHPFDDGNGRIARAITDMLLARADGSAQRFYSMSAQIRVERSAYYDILEKTQSGSLDISGWMEWFLQCLDRAFSLTEKNLVSVLRKAKFWGNPVTALFNERQRLMMNKFLDDFDGKLTSSKWAKIAKCSQDTAMRDIQDLMEKHILEKEAAGGRSTSYVLTTH